MYNIISAGPSGPQAAKAYMYPVSCIPVCCMLHALCRKLSEGCWVPGSAHVPQMPPGCHHRPPRCLPGAFKAAKMTFQGVQRPFNTEFACLRPSKTYENN